MRYLQRAHRVSVAWLHEVRQNERNTISLGVDEAHVR